MSNISVLIFVAFLAALVLGLPNPVHDEDKPGHCYHFGFYIKEGETVSALPGLCMELTCRDAEINEKAALLCDPIITAPEEPKCKLQQEDPTKPYPECCGRVICD